jgi:phosphonatase-like hydrolase
MSTMGELDLVIFDLGGTTIRDSGQVPEAFVAALHAGGFEVSHQEIAQARGASKREVIHRLVERRLPPGDPTVDAQAEAIFSAFRENLARRFSQGGIEVLPGVEETFAWLRDRQVKIAVNTGFDRAITTLVLQAAPGWDQSAVQAVVCGDDVAQGRPAPYMIFHAMECLGVTDVRREAVVGDTMLDLQAGWNAGVGWNIGVWSGAHTREQLEQAPHTHLLPGVADLPEIWKTLHNCVE